MSMEHGHSAAEIRERFDKAPKQNHLRDFIYGGIDGAVTTFAIVAGTEGANLSRVVIIALGVANVLADGFSMAASNYSGTKADLDNIQRLRETERRHIMEDPDGERREVREIFKRKGFSGEALEGAIAITTANEERWIDFMITEEYGIAPAEPHPFNAALATFVAFLLCGVVPLLPFLLGFSDPFMLSTAATAVTFFSIGALKSRWSLVSWWRSGLETLAIGASAAAIAYGAGFFLRGFAAG